MPPPQSGWYREFMARHGVPDLVSLSPTRNAATYAHYDAAATLLDLTIGQARRAVLVQAWPVLFSHD